LDLVRILLGFLLSLRRAVLLRQHRFSLSRLGPVSLFGRGSLPIASPGLRFGRLRRCLYLGGGCSRWFRGLRLGGLTGRGDTFVPGHTRTPCRRYNCSPPHPDAQQAKQPPTHSVHTGIPVCGFHHVHAVFDSVELKHIRLSDIRSTICSQACAEIRHRGLPVAPVKAARAYAAPAARAACTSDVDVVCRRSRRFSGGREACRSRIHGNTPQS
jgi:hypothetical protein